MPAVSEHFDLIHVHHLGRGAIAVASDGSQTPFVFTNHNAARTQLERLVLGAVMARADGIVALSASEAAWQKRTYSKHGAVYAAIPNGVDAGLFRLTVPSRPKQGEPWRLLFAGQLIPMKRVDLLLDAVARLRGQFSMQLKLAYHVNHQEQALRRQVRSLGIEPVVEFAGSLTQPALLNAYRDAHILVLPSDNDSLPSVVTEAMMTGTPIVATDVGSVREQLAGYGVIVQPGSAAHLAAGIEDLLGRYEFHSERALPMSRSARERFSAEAMLAQHEGFYLAVLARTQRARRHSAGNRIGTYLLRGALRGWNKIRR
jgi:glycosyltransferase involved in cell wall biosynthesis